MRVLILSDIHGNVTALNAVMEKVRESQIDSCIFLGDLIDYGMHTNEVIEVLSTVPYTVVCNVWGNHEYSIITGDYSGYSSLRGQQCAKYTHSLLNEESWNYLQFRMENTGKHEFEIHQKKCLAVHGSLEDMYWKSLRVGEGLENYGKYDVVFSGHSHIPHFFEQYFAVNNPTYRDKKKTIFINPGSVGQPRNHNPMAQFAIFDIDTEEVWMEKVAYDIEKEQKAFVGQVDSFYQNRLTLGI